MLQSAKVAPLWSLFIWEIFIVCTWLNIVQSHSESLFRLKPFLFVGPKPETEQFQQSPFYFLVYFVKWMTVISPVFNQDVPGAFDYSLILSFCQGAGNWLEHPFQKTHKIHRNFRFCTQKWWRNGLCETEAALFLWVLVVRHGIDEVVWHHVLNWRYVRYVG